MDPISIIGLLATAGTLASSITFAIRNLSDLRGHYKNADVNIRLFIGQLSTVKSALTQINDWAHYLDDTHWQDDVVEGLKISLEGCYLALDTLAGEISSLLASATSEPSLSARFRLRAQYVLSESSLRQHESRLQAQIAALHPLLKAVQWYSSEFAKVYFAD